VLEPQQAQQAVLVTPVIAPVSTTTGTQLTNQQPAVAPETAAQPVVYAAGQLPTVQDTRGQQSQQLPQQQSSSSATVYEPIEAILILPQYTQNQVPVNIQQ